MRLSPLTPLDACMLLTCALAVPAQENGSAPSWQDYRGPTRDGHAPVGADVPLSWSETENVRWKTAIRGTGWSSPVVEAGTIWLTSATETGHEMSVIAVDLESGRTVHDRRVFEVESPEKKNALNSYASPSAVVEPGRVYVHFGTYGTACLDAVSAETLWERRDLHCDHIEGPGSSPILYRDLLIFNVDGGDVQYVIALDKSTGETRWKTDRTVELDHLVPDLRKAYSTPILVEVDGKPRLISSGAQATAAYDPATGDELWQVRHGGFSMSARPLSDGELLFLNTGFNSPRLVAVRASGTGDVTDSNIVWKYRRNVPKMASAVLHDGHIFMVNDGGIATCLEAKSGRRLWRQRIGGQHSASPVLASGRLYFFDREGRTVVLKAAASYRKLGENQLDSGFMASPAVVGDDFVLRTKTHLYRVGTIED